METIERKKIFSKISLIDINTYILMHGEGLTSSDENGEKDNGDAQIHLWSGEK